MKFYISHNKCDICKNYLISNNKFNFKVTGSVYSARGSLSCNNFNVVYIVSCKNYGDKYVGLPNYLKTKFRIHKSDIKSKKNFCGTVTNFKKQIMIKIIVIYFS